MHSVFPEPADGTRRGYIRSLTRRFRWLGRRPAQRRSSCQASDSREAWRRRFQSAVHNGKGADQYTIGGKPKARRHHASGFRCSPAALTSRCSAARSTSRETPRRRWLASHHSTPLVATSDRFISARRLGGPACLPAGTTSTDPAAAATYSDKQYLSQRRRQAVPLTTAEAVGNTQIRVANAASETQLGHLPCSLRPMTFTCGAS